MSFGVKVKILNGEAFCQCKFPLPMTQEIGRRIGQSENYTWYRCHWCGSVSEAKPLDRS